LECYFVRYKTQQKPNTNFLVLFGFFLICEKVKLAFSIRFAVYIEPETVFDLLFSELSYLHGCSICTK